MRELLFKAKKENSNEWIYSHSMSNHLGGYIYFVYENVKYLSGRLCRVNPNTICQYTGMLDSKGKKIFEGDIVVGTITSAWAKNKIKCAVIYRRDSFVCIENGREHRVLFGKDIEIIGNMHDTPEILKER